MATPKRKRQEASQQSSDSWLLGALSPRCLLPGCPCAACRHSREPKPDIVFGAFDKQAARAFFARHWRRPQLFDDVLPRGHEAYGARLRELLCQRLPEAPHLQGTVCLSCEPCRMAACQRLRFYLGINGPRLVQKYAPDELVRLAPDELAKGSDVERRLQAQATQRAEYEGVAKTDLAQLVLGDARAAIRCSRCGRNNVELSARQKNSADEGMKGEARCECGRKWTL